MGDDLGAAGLTMHRDGGDNHRANGWLSNRGTLSVIYANGRRARADPRG